MSEYILGIDPGLDGAIAFLRAGEVHVFDMPTLEYDIGAGKRKKKRRELDCGRLFRILKKYPSDICILEALAGMPGMGGTQMFTFGQTYGMTKAALCFTGIPYTPVSPQKWKKHFGLSKDKDASRDAASEIFPDFKHLWSRKKDDGRAEALLIAQYGLEHIGLFNSNQHRKEKSDDTE